MYVFCVHILQFPSRIRLVARGGGGGGQEEEQPSNIPDDPSPPRVSEAALGVFVLRSLRARVTYSSYLAVNVTPELILRGLMRTRGERERERGDLEAVLRDLFLEWRLGNQLMAGDGGMEWVLFPFFFCVLSIHFFSLILMLILEVMHWSASRYFFADHTHVHTYNKSTHRHTYTQKHTQANSYHQPASFPTRRLNLGVARNTEQAWVVSDMLKMKWTNGNEKIKRFFFTPL